MAGQVSNKEEYKNLSHSDVIVGLALFSLLLWQFCCVWWITEKEGVAMAASRVESTAGHSLNICYSKKTNNNLNSIIVSIVVIVILLLFLASSLLVDD